MSHSPYSLNQLRVITNLGEIARQQEHFEQSVALHRESLALFQKIEDQWGLALVLTNLAIVLWKIGQQKEAHLYLLESLHRNQNLGNKEGIIGSLEGLAMIMTTQGRIEDAVRVYGATANLRNTLGVPLPFADRTSFDHYFTPARDALGPQQFQQLCTTGSSLSIEQAMALAIS